MRIAFLGIRSVPGRYGGFDTVATELAPRMVRRGCEITVYCQRRYVDPPRPKTFDGVDLVYLSSLPRRSLEETSHELLSLGHALPRRYDALYVFGLRATSLFAPFALAGGRVFFNTDGHDWKRRKWGPRARRYLQFSERIGVRIAGDRLIADSRAIAAYYGDRYRVHPTFIPYGAPTIDRPDPTTLQRYGLEPGNYLLVLCRLEPENNVDVIIGAYDRVRPSRDLVIVGGANYESPYVDRLRSVASERVRFLGPIYDREVVDALYHYSFAYVHGHEVGGTNPALLHAMGAGSCILANDVVYNKEVLGDAGLYWSPTAESLSETFSLIEGDPAHAKLLGEQARARAKTEYDWEDIADRYVEYFRARIGTRRSAGGSSS